MLPLAVARSSSDGNGIRYLLPVLWMTSCFHKMEPLFGTRSEVLDVLPNFRTFWKAVKLKTRRMDPPLSASPSLLSVARFNCCLALAQYYIQRGGD